MKSKELLTATMKELEQKEAMRVDGGRSQIWMPNCGGRLWPPPPSQPRGSVIGPIRR